MKFFITTNLVSKIKTRKQTRLNLTPVVRVLYT